MATTLTNIQTDVRFYAQDVDLVITSGNDLRRANEIYQGIFTPGFQMLDIAIGMRWPERVREDTSLTTTAAQAAYTWPSTPRFLLDDVAIELQDQSGGATYRRLDPVIDELEDLQLRNQSDTLPTHYRWWDASGTTQLVLRPSPVTAGLTIRIRGVSEVTVFADGTTTTEFDNINHDKALAMLIAAMYKIQRGDVGYAQILIKNAKGLLPRYETSPMVSSGKLEAHYL